MNTSREEQHELLLREVPDRFLKTGIMWKQTGPTLRTIRVFPFVWHGDDVAGLKRMCPSLAISADVVALQEALALCASRRTGHSAN